MKAYTITDLFEEMNVNIITGEADALSLRVLCEIPEDIMRLYVEFTGILVDFDSIKRGGPFVRNKDNYEVFLTFATIDILAIMYLLTKPGINAVVEFNNRDGERQFLLAGTEEEVTKYIDDQRKNGIIVTFDLDENGNIVKSSGIYELGRRFFLPDEENRRSFSNIHFFTGLSH